MSVSLGPFITCFVGVIFLAIYLYITLYHLNNHFIYGTKIIFVGITIILLRMCIPVNFPFTYTIYSTKLLTPIANTIYYQIGISNFNVFNLLIICWLSVAIIKLVRLYIKYYRLDNYLNLYIITEPQHHANLFRSLEKYCTKPIKIAVIPQNISPSIFGIKQPILILPETYKSFSQKELDYICLHEINHYSHHDLWMKLLVEIITCIHWWNPLVYLMKKEFSLTLELVNDYQLMNSSPGFSNSEYADLIIKSSNLIHQSLSNSDVGLIPFSREKHSDLYTRINFLLNSPSPQQKGKKSLGVHTMIIIIMIFISLVFVVESTSPETPVSDDGTFTMDSSNTYFKKTPEGYEIYVEGNYVGIVDEIPDDYQNYKIYE
ncbi:MAG: M56 family metallopeptidase [Lachnospiraceae bacterium]